MKMLFTLIMLMSLTTAFAAEPACSIGGACESKEACEKLGGILNTSAKTCVVGGEHKILEDCTFSKDGKREMTGKQSQDASKPAATGAGAVTK